MAKPTIGDENSERLHMRISPEEIESIDDWRFANRVGTRSDAVRRLLQIGLRADARGLAIAEAARASFEGARDVWQEVLDAQENGRSGEDAVVAIPASQIANTLRLTFEAHEAAAGLLADTVAFHQTSDAVDELEKAIAARDEYKKLVRERGDREHEE